MILTHPHDEIKNGDECSAGVGVSLQHDVAEADVVIGRDMASRHSTERRLRITSAFRPSLDTISKKMNAHFLVEFYVLHDLECECEVAKENMHPEKTNDTEVAQHSVKRALTILSDDFPEQKDEL